MITKTLMPSRLEKRVNYKRKPMRVAVIGLGHQAIEDHIPAINSSPDVELVAVVDTNSDLLSEYEKDHKNLHFYVSVKEMLSKEKIDFAVVATPHTFHFEICKKLLKAGVHVLKEKPISTTLAEAKELSRLASMHSACLSVTLQRRFNPIYTTFFQLADKIGKPFCVEGRYTFFTANPGSGWRGKSELAGGGCLIDMGYHMIDLLIWYFGLPDLVAACCSSNAQENASYDVEDTARVYFHYLKKDLWGSLLISRVIPPKQEYIEVYGTRGFVRVERGKIERYSSDGKLLELLQREDSWPSAAQDQIEYFVKVIRGERENISGPIFHIDHMKFIEAAYQAKKIGGCVRTKDLGGS